MTPRIPLTFLALLVSVRVVAATDWYIDADAQLDGDGSESSPWNTLSHLDEVQSDDTVNLAGWFREPFVLTVKSRVTVRSWPGRPRAMIRGDRPVPTADWVPLGAGVFSVDLEPGLAIVSFVWNWDENLTVETPPLEPRHFGHLGRRFSSAQVQQEPGTWFYESSSGRLYLTPPAGVGAQDPDVGDTYAYCVAGHAVSLGGCDGCTFGGIDTALFCQFDGGGGYGVRIGGDQPGPTGNLVEDVTVWDCGYHAAGIVDGARDGNVLRDIVSRGQFANGVAVANPFVFFTIHDGVRGNRGERLVHHAYNVLDHAGVELFSAPMFLTLNAHTDGVARIADLEWRDITVHAYTSTPLVNLAAANDTVTGDPTSAEGYPVRVYDGRIRHLRQRLASGGDVAFIGCRFESFDGDGATTPFDDMVHVADGGRMFLESCVIAAERPAAPAGSMVSVAGTGHLYLRGSTLYRQGGMGSIIDMVSGGRVTAEQCIFARSSVGPLAQATSATMATDVDLTDCWYHGIDENAYFVGGPTGPPDGVRRLEDMQGRVDVDGVYSLDPDFADAPADLHAASDGALMNTRNVLPDTCRFGLDGSPYRGSYGAYQDADCAGDINGDSFVAVDDLMVVFWEWGASSGCPGDVDGDGVVAVTDLLMILNGRGPCVFEIR